MPSSGRRSKNYTATQATPKDVPIYYGLGTHVEAESVLLQDGYTIYASWGPTTLNILDRDATYGFGHSTPIIGMRTTAQELQKEKMPLSDLKCKHAIIMAAMSTR